MLLALGNCVQNNDTYSQVQVQVPLAVDAGRQKVQERPVQPSHALPRLYIYSRLLVQKSL